MRFHRAVPRCDLAQDAQLTGGAMLYAILCYNSEATVAGWSQEEDDAVLARLNPVHDRLTREGKLNHAARLTLTASARTLRKVNEAPVVTDGPFAESKEQLLGFYVVDCASQDEALDIARELAAARTSSTYEVRPISLFLSGSAAGPAS
jgi:hypothetical protein